MRNEAAKRREYQRQCQSLYMRKRSSISITSEHAILYSPLTFFPSLSLLDPSSSAWNLKFSSKKISPSLLFLTASSVSLPTQSGRKVTGLERSSESLSAYDQEARWVQDVYILFEVRGRRASLRCISQSERG